MDASNGDAHPFTGGAGEDSAKTIERLQAKLLAVVGEAVRPATRVALLDAGTGNWGDQAIWLGERRLLQQLDVEVVHEADDLGLDHAKIKRLLGRDGAILLQAGGSLGDIYPLRQQFRELVVTAFPDHRIIQLPQSIWFDDPRSAERTRCILTRHEGYELLVRDEASLRAANESLGMRARLCPDPAFALGRLRRPSAATVSVVFLERRGPEAVQHPVRTPAAWMRSDWAIPTPTRVADRLRLVAPAIDLQLRRRARPVIDGGALTALRHAMLPTVARSRLGLALRFLSQGRVVVTDRLHGHVLCVLIGVPHVLLDNRIGKLSAFVQTWKSDGDIARLCSADEVVAAVTELEALS